MLETVLFWVFAALGIAGGIGLILNRNPIYSALSLILNFFSIAGLYLALSAEFLAAIQILVYAGAIMVLFLFVIMLLNLQEEKIELSFDAKRGLAFILGLAFIAEMFYVFRSLSPFSEDEVAKLSAQDVALSDINLVAGQFTLGQVEPIGEQLMTTYLFPFEMISVILLAALVGAIVVARKHTYQ
ncbi:MAG: NADH-quinone oxidoreductase subunit J [Bacteroidota bacterium]